jgi:hypothetical protein
MMKNSNPKATPYNTVDQPAAKTLSRNLRVLVHDDFPFLA